MWVRYASFFLLFFELTYRQYNYGPPATTTGRGRAESVIFHSDPLNRYLKQEIESSVHERFARVLWHPEDSSKLILATSCTCVFFLVWGDPPIPCFSPALSEDLRMGDMGISYHIPE